MSLRILADHCVSNYIITALRNRGHEVFRLKDHMPTDSPDSIVLSKAQQLDKENPRYKNDLRKKIKDRHKNLWVGLIVIFVLDRINRIDWIYCFLGFRTKPRNSHPAFSGKRKPKRPMVLLPNVHAASLFCFYSQMNSLEEGYRFLPFFSPSRRQERQKNPENLVDPV